MKKSISVILVAALVLFAFTACEQQMPTYKVPTGLTISTTKDAYIDGEKLDVNSITGIVRYSDGSSDTLTGAELSLVISNGSNTDGSVGDGANTVTAVYGAYSVSDTNKFTGDVVTATTTVYGYVPTITFGNLPTTVAQSKEGGDTSQEISMEGVTVTANYNGVSRELSAGEYSLTKLCVNTSEVTVGTIADTPISAAGLKVFGRDITTGVTTGKVVVTAYVGDPEIDTADIVSLEVGYLDEDGEFTTTGSVWYGATPADVFAVQAEDGDGVVDVISNDLVTFEVQAGNLSTTERTNVVAVLKSNATVKSAEFSVQPRNYVTEISGAQKEGTTIDENTSTNSTAFRNNYTVTATYVAPLADGTKTKVLASNEYQISVQYINSTNYTAAKVIYTGLDENPDPDSAVDEVTVGTISFTKVSEG